MSDSDAKATVRGAFVGGVLGLIGLLGVTGLTQLEAEDAEEKRAQGAARVLADDLRRAEDRMYSSLQDCEYRLYDLKTELPVDQRILVAWSLEPGQWEKVGEALSNIRLQVDRSLDETAFDEYDAIQLRIFIRNIDEARQALEDVSGQKPSSPAEVGKRVASGTGPRCLRGGPR